MKRRDFIKIIGSGAFIIPIAPTFALQQSNYGQWKSYRLSYQVSLPETGKSARLWLPLPDTNDSDFQFTQGSNWSGNAEKAGFSSFSGNNFPVFTAEWKGSGPRQITVSSIIKTSNHAINLDHYTASKAVSIPNHAKQFLTPTHLIPVKGIVHETASVLLKNKNTASTLEKARTIYDWVIDNAQHDELVRGRGKGDIKSMLESKTLTGKCVDINSLFVGLSRAAGIPARNRYGIRIDESRLYPGLGKLSDISQSQHCRAEFYLNNLGWIPVDPADVCKVSKLENLPVNHPSITALKEKLFGAWEMNWASFNHIEDVQLATSIIGKLPFFMFPHAEIDGKTLDNLDPEKFSYKIISSELIGTGAKL
ncbi:MAG: transglutaminase-like domain-containing protein [Pseudomonadota bacterium]